jgi:hypothetical protein
MQEVSGSIPLSSTKIFSCFNTFIPHRRSLSEDESRVPWLWASAGSERRRCAGADDFAGDGADAAEAVWTAAFEIIGVAWPQNSAFLIDADFQAAGKDDAAFLSVVDERNLSGVGSRLVAFLQYLQAAPEEIVAHLQEGDRTLADFRQFIGAIEGLSRAFRLEGKEFRQTDRYAVEDALQRADGRIGSVGFDQRDR